MGSEEKCDINQQHAFSVVKFKDVNETRIRKGSSASLARVEGKVLLTETGADLSLYQDLFESAPDAYVVTDVHGAIQQVNKLGEKVLGLQHGFYSGKPLSVLIKIEHRKMLGEIISQLANGQQLVEREFCFCPENGSQFLASVRVAPRRGPDGTVQAIRWILRDITTSILVHGALYKSQDALDRRVRERTAELARVNAALQSEIAAHKKLTEVLLHNEQELTDFFENSTTPMHWAAPDGTILRANKAELTMLGFQREEYIGRNIADFHCDSRVFDEICGRLLANEVVQNLEAQLCSKDGRIKRVLIDAGAYREGDRIVHIRCVTRDITGRKLAEDALRESEERFRQLAENIREIFWLAALDMSTIVYVNSAYEEIFGRSCESLYRNPDSWLESVYDDDRERIKEAIFQATQTGVLDEEFRIVRPDGTIRILKAQGFPVQNAAGKICRIAGVTHDITAQKHADEERAWLIQEQASNRAKDEFLATVAHELRTPLTAILGWTQLLRRGVLNQASTERALAIIERNTQLQAQLIEDLLDASRIAAGKLEVTIRQGDLHYIIDAAVDTVNLMMQSKGISFEMSLDPNVRMIACDPDRLQQVILNLLTNAIKFTGNSGRISLSLILQSECICISVADTGCGIAPEFLPHVFDSFAQSDHNSPRTQRGLGLGLAIVKHIIELHEGRVSVFSRGPGTGATFTIELPLKLRTAN